MRGKLGKTEKCLLAAAAAFLLLTGLLQARDAGAQSDSGFPVTTEAGEDFTYELPEPLDLNTATKEELMALPGVGEVLAERILAYRVEHGPFTCVEELGNVSGIGEKKLEALLPEVTVGEGKTEEETAGETPAEDGKESPHADLSGG